MYLSTSDEVNGVDIDDNSQIQQENTTTTPPPVSSNPSQSSSPSYSTLLVIDDNSNSNDSSLKTIDIPTDFVSSNAQIQITSPPSLPNLDSPNDTPAQQRRRNSSIAKLLGGQPLNNEQYKVINQQILEDQSAQNVPSNGEPVIDGEIHRSRSSITRSLLMNAVLEQSKNSTTQITKTRPTSPSYSKDVEYLIRRELVYKHDTAALRRDSSTPSVFQSLSSIRNSPTANSQPVSNSNSKLKRKRTHQKQLEPLPTTNKPLNVAPFTLRDPFEIDSSGSSLVAPINSTPNHRIHHQNDLYHYDVTHRHQNHPSLLPSSQQQYALPMNNSTPFNYQKLNAPAYAPYKIPHDRSSTTTSSISSSYSGGRYPHIPELTLPTPILPLSTHVSTTSITSNHPMGASSRKIKTIHGRPDLYEIPSQRSSSITSNQSNVSSSSSSSSGHSIPLKKRLLHAYKNEQRPSSSL
ncbi:unnamed protein product [Adineta steineri]|uniref:Uncharacterized protein n=1 Tax=Adineta steineri TaxID=433720 RepID=A0A818NHU1_9BILA|nr:unnamed protein product [Adineta steineri]CAF3607239.1 unnamed protein product [Adineta steineri]